MDILTALFFIFLLFFGEDLQKNGKSYIGKLIKLIW